MVEERSAHGLRRVVVATLTAFVLTACGDEPLEGIGQRSGEWIGPLAEEVSLLPGG